MRFNHDFLFGVNLVLLLRERRMMSVLGLMSVLVSGDKKNVFPVGNLFIFLTHHYF